MLDSGDRSPFEETETSGLPKTEPSRDTATPPMLWAALTRLLRPLVQTLIGFGVTYPQCAALLKATYVDIARNEFYAPNGKQTDSRISVLTGVHRKDVRRLGAEPADDMVLPPEASLAAQIIGVWLGAPEYTDDEGAPRRLPRGAAPGTVSFESLVESVTKDVRARTLLDECLARKLVAVDEDGVVRLLQDAFVPDNRLDELAYYFGRNLHDHIATAGKNLTPDAEPRLERSVYYARLTPASVARLHAHARRAGMAALTRVNKLALALSKSDAGDPDATKRMSFGVYFYDAERDPAAPEPNDPDEPADEAKS